MSAHPDVDLARIAFVTRAYGRLQGSILSAFFVPFAVLAAQRFREDDVSATFAWILVLCVVGAAGASLVHYWMDRYFGRVVGDGAPFRWNAWRPLLLGGAYSMLEKFDGWSLREGQPSVMLMAAGAVVLWMAVRDWPHRQHMALTVFVCFAGAALLPLAGAGQAPQWRVNLELAAAASWIVVCALDFLMLRRFLGGQRRVDTTERTHADSV